MIINGHRHDSRLVLQQPIPCHREERSDVAISPASAWHEFEGSEIASAPSRHDNRLVLKQPVSCHREERSDAAISPASAWREFEDSEIASALPRNDSRLVLKQSVPCHREERSDTAISPASAWYEFENSEMASAVPRNDSLLDSSALVIARSKATRRSPNLPNWSIPTYTTIQLSQALLFASPPTSLGNPTETTPWQ